MFALIVTGEEVRLDGETIAEEGEKFMVVELQGFATSERIEKGKESVLFPLSLKTFKTREEAEEFGKSWKGHPWWCKPRDFEVIEVEHNFTRMLTGFIRK